MRMAGSRNLREGGMKNGGYHSKRKAAETAATVRRRAALKKNADSICKQFNAKALETQEKFHV